jgi:hypothetical protein
MHRVTHNTAMPAEIWGCKTTSVYNTELMAQPQNVPLAPSFLVSDDV